MSSEKITVITKDTINRLLRDVKQVIKNPLSENGIYYVHDDEDILKGYALIIGPSDTPYFGGFLRLNTHLIIRIVHRMSFIAPTVSKSDLIQIYTQMEKFVSLF
jgi:hypothetical protein